MDARGMLKLGIALSVVGALASLLAGLVDTGSSAGLDDLLRPVANVATLFGLLSLILAVYALAAPATMPRSVLVGALLFTLGRLGSVALGLMITRNSIDPTVGLLFTSLGLVSAVGTIVLFYGVFQVVRDRLASSPAPRSAPGPAPAIAPRAAPTAATEPRRSSFRPPQAPLPPSKPPDAQRPPPR